MTTLMPFFFRKRGAFLDEEQPRFDPPAQMSPLCIFLGNSGMRNSPMCASIGASPMCSQWLGVMLSVFTLLPTLQTVPLTIHAFFVFVLVFAVAMINTSYR